MFAGGARSVPARILSLRRRPPAAAPRLARRRTAAMEKSPAGGADDADARVDAVVDVRRDDASAPPGTLTIEIPFPPPLGAKTLARAADEPLGRALGRLRATLAKARKGGGGGSGSSSSSSADAPALRDAGTDGAPVPDDVPNLDAWREGRVLVVDGAVFRVRVDAPSVASVRVAGVPRVGRPLVAVAGGVRFCDEDDLAFRWIRNDDRGHHDRGGASSVVVGRGKVYVPTSSDVGASLVAEAAATRPGDAVACGAPARVVLVDPVEPAEARPNARARVEALNEVLNETGARRADVLRVMTYNALADAYAHTWGGLYPYLRARDADVHRRLPRAMEDVADADPDVVCLQEIDRKWYDLFWLPQMRAAGFEPAGGLAEKTGLSREGCCVFFRRDRYALVRADAVDLKTCDANAFPNDEERDVAEWVRAQPHLRRTLANVSTVGIVATLEPKPVTDKKDDGKPPASRARGDVTVANAHLFFQPGATHVRILQTRWLLRHADIARKRREAELLLTSGASSSPGAPARPLRCALVVCGDMNAEPFDGAARFAAEGAIGAGDADWALGSAFRWGGTSSRAHAAGIVARGREECAPGESGEGRGAPAGAPREGSAGGEGREEARKEKEKTSGEASSSRNGSSREEGGLGGGPDADPSGSALASIEARLGRMAASWRVVAEVERGTRVACGVRDEAAECARAKVRAHADAGCTFKTCAAVAAWALREDAGMEPGIAVPGLSKVRFPGQGGGQEGGNGPVWGRAVPGDDAPRGDGDEGGDAGADEGRDVAALSRAVASLVDARAATVAELVRSASSLERTERARDAIDAANARSGGWAAVPIGACGLHLRHPFSLASACGEPEWTNFVSGFRGALDYVWCDEGGEPGSGRALRPVAAMPMPPLEAVRAQVALPNAEFPSDHLPMVADLEHV